MELEGMVWKDPKSSFWLAEVDFLDVMTQGKSRKEACKMLEDAILALLEDAYDELLDSNFRLQVHTYEKGVLGIGATNEKLLFALGLKRQREKSGISIREAAYRLHSSSPNAYARYERGKVRPSIEKYAELVHAVNPNRRPLLLR